MGFPSLMFYDLPMLKAVKYIVVVAIVASALLAAPSVAEQKIKVTKIEKLESVKCRSTKVAGHTAKDVAPAMKVMPRLPRTITLQTNCGNIVITTVGAKAPVTVTQMATLARGGFFDNSLCHRLTTQGLYVLQCGDPTATGAGGPNFSYRDENLPANTANNYPAGTVAMANSGPSTNGSQFFLVFADTTLGPNYTIWGTITQGLDIVKYIAKLGVKGGGADGPPAQSIAILRATVTN